MLYIDGSVQDCSNSSALAMELLQSCAEPSIRGLTKTVIILQTTHSYTFSWLKIILFWFKFYCNLMPRGRLRNLTLVQIVTWHQAGNRPLSEPDNILNWCIYASLSIDDLNPSIQIKFSCPYFFCIKSAINMFTTWYLYFHCNFIIMCYC